MAKSKAPVDGMDMWATLRNGTPSPRKIMIYSVEPQQAGISVDDWKLVWRASLPSSIELFDLKADPYEKNNLAAANPQKVAELQALIEAEARVAAPSKFVVEAFGALWPVLFGNTFLPGQEDVHSLDSVP